MLEDLIWPLFICLYCYFFCMHSSWGGEPFQHSLPATCFDRQGMFMMLQNDNNASYPPPFSQIWYTALLLSSNAWPILLEVPDLRICVEISHSEHSMENADINLAFQSVFSSNQCYLLDTTFRTMTS